MFLTQKSTEKHNRAAETSLWTKNMIVLNLLDQSPERERERGFKKGKDRSQIEYRRNENWGRRGMENVGDGCERAFYRNGAGGRLTQLCSGETLCSQPIWDYMDLPTHTVLHTHTHAGENIFVRLEAGELKVLCVARRNQFSFTHHQIFFIHISDSDWLLQIKKSGTSWRPTGGVEKSIFFPLHKCHCPLYLWLAYAEMSSLTRHWRSQRYNR